LKADPERAGPNRGAERCSPVVALLAAIATAIGLKGVARIPARVAAVEKISLDKLINKVKGEFPIKNQIREKSVGNLCRLF